LEKKIKDAKAEHETRAREEAAHLLMAAEREKALTAQEKETFNGFLHKEFFTKNDFGALEKFYAKTWDRLSEHGKDEMSHRVWEGIRRDEYSFTELPKVVREKEMERAYGRLNQSAIGAGAAAEIPEKDRQDFIRAYEAGKKDEAAKALERESFKKVMFRGGDSKSVRSIQATRESEGVTVGAKIAASAPQQNEKSEPREQDLDLSGIQLGGAKMTDAKNPPSVSDIPQNGPMASKTNSLIRGG
jgi:hypothetical protein